MSGVARGRGAPLASRLRHSRRDVLALAAVCAATFVLALVGRLTAPDDIGYALVWPLAGLAVLWFLHRGPGLGPLDLLAVAGAGGLALLATGASPVHAATGGVLVLVQPAVTVLLMRRLTPELAGRPFAVAGGGAARAGLRTPGVLARFGLALVGGTATTWAVQLVVALLNHGMPAGPPLGMWFVRDLCWAFLVVTAGLAYGKRRAARLTGEVLLHRGSRAELVAVLAVSATVFTATYVAELLPLAYPLVLTTVWLALRFDLFVTTWHTLFFGAASTALTITGRGPFAGVGGPVETALYAQAFVILLGTVGLVISAERSQVQHLNAQLSTTGTAHRNQADLFGQMIDAMTEGVMVVDAEGRVVVSNPAIERLLGASASGSGSGLAGLMGFDLDGNRLAEDQRPSRRALAGERVVRELVLYRREGLTDVVLAATALPLPHPDGRRAMILVEDVTVEHQRRADLVTFAHMVAHDLRNPLTTIRGWTLLMRKRFDEHQELPAAELLAYLRRTENAADRMDELIAHLLDRATGEVEPSEEDVDLADLVAQVARDRGIVEQVRVEPLPVVRADAGMLRQLVDNVLANATKFAREEIPCEVVCSSRLTDDGMLVTLVDNGVGVPAGQHEQIFREGHRGHGASYDGTGLGLAVCRRIAGHHGGSIRAVDNPDGPGTAFEVRLPLERVVSTGAVVIPADVGPAEVGPAAVGPAEVGPAAVGELPVEVTDLARGGLGPRPARP